MATRDRLDDTAKLEASHSPLDELRAAAVDDTVRIRDAFRSALIRQPAISRKSHPFAHGVIRFYRARTLLAAGQDDDTAIRAWRYLAPLAPSNLPASVRHLFLELIYIVNQSDDAAVPRARVDNFRALVIKIADRIDAFVDDIAAIRESRGE